MTPQFVTLPAFAVVGLTTRTANSREMSGRGRIGALWQEFMQGGSSAIQGVTDPSLTFSIYTDYESDHTGEYSVILGKPVSELGIPAPPLRGIEIPPAEYAVFPATASPDSIRAAWMNVYEYFATQRDVDRTFNVDFELYSPDGVALYIAVKR